MANKHRDIDQEKLTELAEAYCDECLAHKKTFLSNQGNPVELEDRYIPTVDFFLHHWLRKNHKEFYKTMLKESQFYRAMRESDHPLSQTIKNIRELFDGAAVDIVANEGRGIFYAKNRLGMTDKIHNLNEEVKISFED